MTETRFVTTLVCGHVIMFGIRPDDDDYIWCVRCDTGRRVFMTTRESAWKYHTKPEIRYRKNGRRFQAVCFTCGTEIWGNDFPSMMRNTKQHDWDAHVSFNRR